jgi:hypothetical protein
LAGIAALAATGGAILQAAPAAGQRAGAAVTAARADFADLAQGTYWGDVISDARGSPRPGVRITVAKIGPNRVRVTADDARLPAFTAQLIRAMGTVQNASGAEIFRLDLSKKPRTLTVTLGDASWAGVRE